MSSSMRNWVMLPARAAPILPTLGGRSLPAGAATVAAGAGAGVAARVGVAASGAGVAIVAAVGLVGGRVGDTGEAVGAGAAPAQAVSNAAPATSGIKNLK